jgi:ParB/RepB/Spo0J family partition protein
MTNQTITTLDPKLVKKNPSQPRVDMGDITALANSIKERGQLYPVIVIKDGDSYTLVDGHRRWTAAKKAKVQLKAIVVTNYDEAFAVIDTIAAACRPPSRSASTPRPSSAPPASRPRPSSSSTPPRSTSPVR